MKRSGQVALVLMGLTGTTAAGAYMMPSRPDCRPAPAASTTLNPPNAATPLAPGAAAAEPCRRRSWSGWRWNSYSSGWGHSGYSGGWFSRTSAPTSISTALSSSGRSSTGTSTSRSSGSSTARGGFGSTGHGTSGGHSGT